jgi:hypothetical protein
MRAQLPAILLIGVSALTAPTASDAQRARSITVTVKPAAAGPQLVRLSLPLPRGLVRKEQTLLATDGKRETGTALRVLTWHPVPDGAARTARRALVTFAYDFGPSKRPVKFTFHPVKAVEMRPAFRVRVRVEGETVSIRYRNGPLLKARLLAPPRTSTEAPQTETVESNACFLWTRTHFPDANWPRVIEVRADVSGGVAVIAHLQRNLPGDGRAPDFGWEIETPVSSAHLQSGARRAAVTDTPSGHSFAEGAPGSLFFENGLYRISHPTAHFKRRGRLETKRGGDGKLSYRYLACTEAEKVPMQQASWRRAEFVVAPAGLAPLTPTLESPHEAQIDGRLWDQLYDTGPALEEGVRRWGLGVREESNSLTPHAQSPLPELRALLRFHHEAIVRSMAHGDDWGNVTGYTEESRTGGVFGMNRLNHCPPIFEEGWRSGDRRLLEVAVLWCENFYDQSIWWGDPARRGDASDQRGGTRYNNILAMGQTPPDNDRAYMWRSNSAVSFCTKGCDSFFLAYEQTGDPRMLEALKAQVDYAAKHLNAGPNYTRNVGDVRDFVRLYRYTGERRYLNEAQRLFRELRTQLSTGDLFTESGRPIESDPPFIEDDQAGYNHPFAKPYIIGYALAGLPELARLAPDEPKLREVVRAVADFLAESQDAVGGWRYPHPRSSSVTLSQAMEHAWQLAQADKLLGPQEKHLDAIERVLRQRLLGWRKTGSILSGLTGWEWATGKVKQGREMVSLYQRPADRDFTRDYAEGQLTFGSAPPEGIVYLPEVLAFYLRHRPLSRLTAEVALDEPLGKVLAQIADKR